VIQSDTIRFLFDVEVGGPPRAFECKLVTGLGYSSDLVCGFVTRTLSGMRQHQDRVHDFRPQKKLFESEIPRSGMEKR